MPRLLWLSLVAALATALCIAVVDQPLAHWVAARDTHPDAWNQIIALLEYPLGIEPWRWTGICVLVAGCLVTLSVPRLRPAAAAFLAVTLTHLLCRHASLWVKTFTGRLRPNEWLERGGDMFWRDGGYSFPSGHVLLFASIVLPIVALYPRTRPLLAIVAFVMIARLAVNAHFASDVLGGLAVTTLFTWLSVVTVRRVLPSQIRPASLR
ncbi:MAG TPA: phosphatase PAP2 family protein [Kofleriaceae bacterium]|nr:phosphatase PAP2 family protein [Kofleriaceae bacterium]